jgi:hypothetical protein
MKEWIHIYDKIWLICPTFAEDNNWSFFDKHVASNRIEVINEVNENQLNKIWNWCKQAKIKDPNLHFLIYFDDCTGQPAFKSNQETGVLNQLCSKGNHANISIIFVVQKFTQASTIMRTNSECLVSFYTQSDAEKSHIYKEFGCGTKKNFCHTLDIATREPYHSFYVNRQGPGEADYYHNFKKINFNPYMSMY